MKELVSNETAKMVERASDEVLRDTLRKAQNGFGAFVYNVVELVMMDLLRRDVIGDTLDAHVARFFEKDEAAEGLWKRMFTSTSFMGRIENFAGHRMDTATEDKK